MNHKRRIKIVATLGPSSSEEATIQRLHEAGADDFRINMSHAGHELMRELVGRIRRVERLVGRPIGIMVDLQGPKLRVGTFGGGDAELAVGIEASRHHIRCRVVAGRGFPIARASACRTRP